MDTAGCRMRAAHGVTGHCLNAPGRVWPVPCRSKPVVLRQHLVQQTAQALAASRCCRPRSCCGRTSLICRAEGGDGGGQGSEFKKSTEFGYSRKDVLLVGVGITAAGYALYYGLQAGGVSAGMAGNFVQLFVVLGLCIGWIGSYLGRVANKDMTYVKQLRNYEEEVMRKRLEEMPQSAREKLMEEVEVDRQRREKRERERAAGDKT